MATVNNFPIDSLDFDGIVSNLKQYLSYQKEFTDYDFTGSALSTLINLLAYNTHYNLVYDNFALNESFLNSAVKRNSILSQANLINYLPRSSKAATAYVNITINDVATNPKDTTTKYTIPSNTQFTTTTGNTTYSFYTKNNITLKSNSDLWGTYTACNIPIIQGTPIHKIYKFKEDYEKFVIGDETVDLDTLSVSVLNRENNSLETYNRADNLFDVDETSKVYFISVNGLGQYQIQFGASNLGKSPLVNDIVYINYMITEGAAANNLGKFQCASRAEDFGFSPHSGMFVYCVQKSSGGAAPESAESVRLLAPKVYTAQNRCITAEDFKYIVKSEFSNCLSIRAWGGQDMNPPQYGKVFLSIITQDGNSLTDYDKEYINENILKNKKPIATLVEFVEPEKLNVIINSAVYYNGNKTTLEGSDIETIVRQAILQYNKDSLNDFGTVLKYSKLCAVIDSSDNNGSIENNITTIRLAYDLKPNFNTLSSYTININNSIYNQDENSSILSTGFYCSDGGENLCYIEDDHTDGSLKLFYYDKNNNKVTIKKIGRVDYNLGTININNINITNIPTEYLRFVCNPYSNNVASRQNQFIVIDKNSLVINVVDTSSQESYNYHSSK